MINLSKFEILKSEQKDEIYRKKLTEKIDNLSKSITQNFQALINGRDISLISDLVFYACTTIANRQTIGQEYYNLIFYKEATRSLPNVHERIFIIAARIVLPYLLDRLDRKPNFKHKLTLNLIRLLFFYAEKVNLILFYFGSSSFFNLGNRLANIKLLSINLNKVTSNYQRKMYLVFGILELINLILNITSELKELYINHQNSLISNENTIANHSSDKTSGTRCRIKCPLCLEMILHPTLTACGHMFCWYCINEYTMNISVNSNESKCPTCRKLFEKKRLIYLYNF